MHPLPPCDPHVEMSRSRRRSGDRILTTHTGSLPRPADLDQQISDKEPGKKVDSAAFDARVTEAALTLWPVS